MMIRFASLLARQDFETVWLDRTGGSFSDLYTSGLEVHLCDGADANRAEDIASEVLGVEIVDGDDGAVGWADDMGEASK